MRRLLVIGIMIFAAWNSLVYAGDKITVSEKGKTIIEAKAKNLKIKATITSSPVKTQQYNSYYQLRSCIQNIDIIANGKKLFVPKSAYLDVCNASSVEVDFNNNECVLKIFGGDAAESYIVHVYFNSKMVTRRSVYGGELPDDEPLEETRYWQRMI